MRSPIARALHHAVALSLAVSPLVGCGGATVAGTSSGSGATSGTGGAGATGGTGAAGGAGATTSTGSTTGASGGATGASGNATGTIAASGTCNPCHDLGCGCPTSGSSGVASGATWGGTSGTPMTTGTPNGDASVSGSSVSGASVSGSGASGSGASGSTSGEGGPIDAGMPVGCAVKAGSAQTSQCMTVFDLASTVRACNPDGGPGDYFSPAWSTCTALCPPTDGGVPVNYCYISEDDQGPHLTCDYCFAITGRRPEGLAEPSTEAPDATARFLATASYLEAASVHAFERMARELEEHGAPSRLARKARRAARDEVRHARLTRRLAERAGASVPEVRGAPHAARRLGAQAVENATEGCVRETLGAAIAMMQAARAGDPEVRRAMQTVARDETRHAELSWEVARWLDGRLDARARARVRRARNYAVRDLLAEVAGDPEATLVARLGAPTAAQVRAAIDALQTSLWSQA